MSKRLSKQPPLSEEEVQAFYDAVYPEFGNLARASYGLEASIREATSELQRLRAGAARGEENPKPPRSPIEVEVTIGAEDMDYVARRLLDLAHMADERTPETFQMFGGGAGGNIQLTTRTRDVSVEQYRVELDAWWRATKAAPPPSPSESVPGAHDAGERK